MLAVLDRSRAYATAPTMEAIRGEDKVTLT